MRNLIIRNFKKEDKNIICQICFNTALYGQPIKKYIKEKSLIAETFLEYYIRFEPENIIIAETDGQVVGYLAGCFDTKNYEKKFIFILPRILQLFFIKGYFFKISSWKLVLDSIRSGLKWNEFHSKHLLKAYPAHFHIDIDGKFQGQGIGAMLIKAFINSLKKNNICGVHLDTATEGGKKFFYKMGFSVISKYKTSTFFHLTPRELWVMVRKLK